MRWLSSMGIDRASAGRYPGNRGSEPPSGSSAFAALPLDCSDGLPPLGHVAEPHHGVHGHVLQQHPQDYSAGSFRISLRGQRSREALLRLRWGRGRHDRWAALWHRTPPRRGGGPRRLVEGLRMRYRSPHGPGKMRLLLNVLWVIFGGGFIIWLEYMIGGL